jgi:general secretion pathway protein B
MSYILDALRRADSERERGAVPGLHAQPAPAQGDAAGGARGLWPWAAAALVAVVGGVAVVNVLLPESGPVAQAPARVPVTAPGGSGAPAPPLSVAAPAPPPVAAATPAPTPAPRVVTPAQVRPAKEAAAPPPPATTAAAPVQPKPATPPRPLAEAPPAAPVRAAVPGSGPVATGAQRAAEPEGPANRVFALNELPDDVRRGLPALAISGASYSETPAHRMLIANGQVFREGEEPAPGLVLEQIRLKTAVLRYRGVRYSVPY